MEKWQRDIEDLLANMRDSLWEGEESPDTFEEVFREEGEDLSKRIDEIRGFSRGDQAPPEWFIDFIQKVADMLQRKADTLKAFTCGEQPPKCVRLMAEDMARQLERLRSLRACAPEGPPPGWTFIDRRGG